MSKKYEDNEKPQTASLVKLTLEALGVVFGGIGTSPLSALKECFRGQHAPCRSANVLGVLPLMANFGGQRMLQEVSYEI